MLCPGGCTINTEQPFTIAHFQNSSVAATVVSQGSSSDSFPECRNAATLAAMAASYTDMVFTASLWGGGGIDMGWLDGMTGCGGECDIDSATVTMTNFQLTS